MYRDELIKQIEDKYKEHDLPIPDIDKKEKQFNDGWW